jgi:hypothetical protein
VTSGIDNNITLKSGLKSIDKMSIHDDVIKIPMLNMDDFNSPICKLHFRSYIYIADEDWMEKDWSPMTRLAKKFYAKYIISPLNTTLSIKKQ